MSKQAGDDFWVDGWIDGVEVAREYMELKKLMRNRRLTSDEGHQMMRLRAINSRWLSSLGVKLDDHIGMGDRRYKSWIKSILNSEYAFPGR